MPRVIALDPQRPARSAIAEAAQLLREGGLVAFPTETVYGLGARATSARAVGRVFEVKGRPASHPLILHVEGEDQARALASRWPERASRLAAAFWPGPLTLVLERAAHVSPLVSGGGDSIAVRAPAHAVARALVAALGDAVAAPSANRYQGLSPTTAAHVVSQLGDAMDLVLDGGPCDAGIESTVVDVRGEHPLVLRPGALGMAALRAVAPDVETRVDVAGRQDARPSPGMDRRHYSPRARLLVAPTGEDACRMAYALLSGGGRVGLVFHDAAPPLPEARLIVRCLPADPALYARSFYATLHGLDAAGVEAIVVQQVPPGEAWWAVADRLRRGAAPA